MDIKEFFAERGYSPNTIASYSRVLNEFLADVEVDAEHPTAYDVRQWLDKHKTWGPNHRWVALNAIRSFLRWRFGSQHPALKVRIKRPSSPQQRVLREDDICKIWNNFDLSTPKGVRDAAIFALFLDTGLRVSEMCRVDLDHLDLAHRSLSVIVKGGHWGDAVFSEATAGYLRQWLLEIRASFAKRGVRTIFVSLNGKTQGQPLTRHGLQQIVRRWGEDVGIRLSPHDLRRTFATIATRAGAPERVLMAAGRWSSSKMIAVYTRTITAEDFEPYFPMTRLLPSRDSQ